MKRTEATANNYTYEIFFESNNTTPELWQIFLKQIGKYLSWQQSWQILVRPRYNTFHYYVITPKPLPINLTGGFLLRSTALEESPNICIQKFFWNTSQHNLITILHQAAKRNLELVELKLTFRLSKFAPHGDAQIITKDVNNKLTAWRLSIFAPAILLSVDFNINKNYSYKKYPKYLKLDKVLGLFNSKIEDALLRVETYPYAEGDFFLHLSDYDFAKHSLILGSSGAGKSKLISLLVHKIAREGADRYKIVIIDPHDNLKNDLSDIESQGVYDFRTLEHSIDLFRNTTQDLNVSVELTLSLFENLLGNSYNGQVARVLRFGIYLLLANDELSFLNLRRLLADLEYRMTLVTKLEGKVPLSVTRFFLTDFSEIKNQFYKDAIAPVITFVDEMQMIPVFNQDAKTIDLHNIIANNFLNIFSLNRLSLGDKVVQTIAGLLMQQLFLLVQTQAIKQHLIIIIDEVAVIENPVLARFLSELRKYHASVILAGQYFSQISEDLRASILTNTANYYTFRVSKNDANLIAQNLELKLVGQTAAEDVINFLIYLKNRECVARISYNGELLPAFLAKTMDCPDLVYQEAKNAVQNSDAVYDEDKHFNFVINTNVKLRDLMKVNSTSRKKLP